MFRDSQVPDNFPLFVHVGEVQAEAAFSQGYTWTELTGDNKIQTALSHLQRGRDNFGYRREVSVPEELNLLAEGQDPVMAHGPGNGGHLVEEERKKGRRTKMTVRLS